MALRVTTVFAFLTRKCTYFLLKTRFLGTDWSQPCRALDYAVSFYFVSMGYQYPCSKRGQNEGPVNNRSGFGDDSIKISDVCYLEALLVQNNHLVSRRAQR